MRIKINGRLDIRPLNEQDKPHKQLPYEDSTFTLDYPFLDTEEENTLSLTNSNFGVNNDFYIDAFTIELIPQGAQPFSKNTHNFTIIIEKFYTGSYTISGNSFTLFLLGQSYNYPEYQGVTNNATIIFQELSTIKLANNVELKVKIRNEHDDIAFSDVKIHFHGYTISKDTIEEIFDDSFTL